jgi:hypothetical protein
MRPASAILIVTTMLWANWANAQEEGGLPKASLGDAGRAAGFARFLCDVPGSEVDAFQHKVDALTSGGTSSGEYRAGEAEARALIDNVRHNSDGDVSELKASTCHDALRVIRRTMAEP